MRPEIAAAEWRNSNSIWENAGLDYWPHMVMIQLSFEFHKTADGHSCLPVIYKSLSYWSSCAHSAGGA